MISSHFQSHDFLRTCTRPLYCSLFSSIPTSTRPLPPPTLHLLHDNVPPSNRLFSWNQNYHLSIIRTPLSTLYTRLLISLCPCMHVQQIAIVLGYPSNDNHSTTARHSLLHLAVQELLLFWSLIAPKRGMIKLAL